MADLVIFIGVQGSGKSHAYATRYAATHEHVSKDLIRSGDRDLRQRRLIEAALRAGRSVVVDNTNPTPAVRAPLVALGRAHGARVVAVHFRTPLAECVARNRTRVGRARVPEVAIYVTSKRLVPPSPDEGFDAIEVVT